MDAVTLALAKGYTDGICDLRLRNRIKNGNFAQGTTSWESGPAGTTIVASGKILTHTGNSQYNYPYQSAVATRTGQRIYVRVRARVLNDASTSLAVMYTNPGLTTGATQTSPAIDTWYTLSFTSTLNNDQGAMTLYVYHNYPSAQAVNRQLEVQSVLCIDLTTTFGAGNEPTKEEMDALIAILGGWFDGTITVTQKQAVIWLLKMIRANRNAIIAGGGSVVI